MDAKVESEWLWKGQRVYMSDGTRETMSESTENQAAYPQLYSQKPGPGFPIARVCAITSLAWGFVVMQAKAKVN